MNEILYLLSQIRKSTSTIDIFMSILKTTKFFSKFVVGVVEDNGEKLVFFQKNGKIFENGNIEKIKGNMLKYSFSFLDNHFTFLISLKKNRKKVENFFDFVKKLLPLCEEKINLKYELQYQSKEYKSLLIVNDNFRRFITDISNANSIDEITEISLKYLENFVNIEKKGIIIEGKIYTVDYEIKDDIEKMLKFYKTMGDVPYIKTENFYSWPINFGENVVGIIGFKTARKISISDSIISFIDITRKIFEREILLDFLRKKGMESFLEEIFRKSSIGFAILEVVEDTEKDDTEKDDTEKDNMGKDLRILVSNKNFIPDIIGSVKHDIINSSFFQVSSRKEIGFMDRYYVLNIIPLHEGKVVLEVIDDTDRVIGRISRAKDFMFSSIGKISLFISHEIRNPLQSIVGFSELILSKAEQSEIRNWAMIINSMAERISSVVKSVLDLSREHIRTRFSLKGAISSAINLLSISFQRSNIEVSFNVLEDAEIFGSPATFQHIIINLASNSIDAIEEKRKNGKEAGKIKIELKRIREDEKEYALFTFEDDGIGIPDDKKDKIFTPFFTTKLSGSGIGMFIISSAVRDMGGSIWFDSKYEVGTKFYIKFPLN